ncbi:beta strand repeat-containing protein [Methylomagnum ishizawai]|uniref:beta strand repeat-containing protein n=1 Tax=Methylomagnum ishizawai TaxID=1760988 RepID=UPI001C341785|nr:FG-GAP-like repeat-containing protein [Methylomagnum ishizawai]BBL73132.1 hypothetical protein MishRS11D_02300 [Methylomagnum ishizawai]
MATYHFSSLSNNQTLAFKPAVDTLVFDIAGLDAATGTLAPSGANLLVTYAGKTLVLANTTLDQVSSARFSFANGSKLLIGDNSSGTAGDSLSNALVGTAFGDYLDGRGGADSMTGGDGNDTYVVDSTGDVVVETNTSATQIDTVLSYLAAYTLPANVENLRLVGAGGVNGTGNGLNNLLYASSGNNALNGGAGTDTASYLYAAAAVKVDLGKTGGQATGGSGTDTLANIENLTGGAFNDSLYGNSGGNVLDGGAGADRLYGGPGNDTYVVDHTGDMVQDYIPGLGAGGIDTVQSYLADYTLPYFGGGDYGIEILRLMGTGNLNGTGNGGDNTLYANAGNNSLNGAGGIDTLSYVFSSAAVTVSLAQTTAQATGGSGTDTIRHFENLTGSAFNDKLTGNAGDNGLDGGSGADTLSGGDGNDTYVVDNSGDVVVETNASADQTDSVRSSLTAYTLPANVENLQLLGGGNLNGTGNALGNVIYANAGNNRLDGGAGSDTASYANAGAGVVVSLAVATAQATGGSGSDTLLNFENLAGSAYADTLTGNGAANVLTGGGGADRLGGGDGNDRLVVSDLGFALADGGAGTDTLVLAGTGLYLDLAAQGGKLAGLESIDLGGGANTLVLTPATVKSLSTTSETLVIDGSAQSLVSGGGGWVQGANATANGHSYRTYTQAGATVWVGTDIGTNNLNIGTPPRLDLGGLNGNNGFRLDGAAFDYAGTAVGAAGDINGDGYGDLAVTTAYSGMSYLVFGKAGGFAASTDLSTLNGGNGFALYGGEFAIAGAGDINGDGYADVVVGDYSGGTPTGYVVFGSGSGFSSLLDLSTLTGTNGFRFSDSAAVDPSAVVVGAAGDVNGDGYADIIVGEKNASPLGRDYAGSSFVVFGKASGFSAGLDLSTLNGATGFRIDGVAGQHSGVAVAAAGDINGDGYADLLVDTVRPYGSAQAKQSYVVFGKATGFGSSLDLSTLNGGNGFRLDAGDGYTGAVAAAGDVNGDGFGDVIVGSGDSAAVVFGKSAGFGSNLDLSTLDGSNGFQFTGLGSYGALATVAAAGDVNGDGYDDVLIGAKRYDPASQGYQAESYVIYGKATGFPASLDAATLNGANGFRLDGADRVGPAGDINGDGFSDLIIGDPTASPNGNSQAGSSYVLFGGNFTNAVAKLGGTGNDSLTGTSAAERLVGGQGNDTLAGGGGSDIFYGGQGDDLIKVSDLGFRQVDGGGGSDTLALGGAGQNLNLAGFRNRIDGIEKIDLTGGGDNTLTLLKRDLVNLSNTSNTLQVNGNAGDHYHFSDAGWTQKADVTLVGVTYHVFDNGAAHLLLNAALTAV